MRSVKILGGVLCAVGGSVAVYGAVDLATGGGVIPRGTAPTILVFSGLAVVAGLGLLRLKKWAWFLGLVLFVSVLIVGVSRFMLSLSLLPQQGQTEYLVSGTALVCLALAGFWALWRPEVKQQVLSQSPR